MKKSELVKLKKLLKQEIDRRDRINKLLSNNSIQEFLLLNNLNIHELQIDDKWLILNEILKDFQITESNGILVCTGSYLISRITSYHETDFEEVSVSFDDPYVQYQKFEDIETRKIYTAHTDKDIQRKIDYLNGIKMDPKEFCHSRYKSLLVSELMAKHIILNPYNTSKNKNGFMEVQKDFFTTAIEQGQPKAKELILNKYPQMK